MTPAYLIMRKPTLLFCSLTLLMALRSSAQTPSQQDPGHYRYRTGERFRSRDKTVNEADYYRSVGDYRQELKSLNAAISALSQPTPMLLSRRAECYVHLRAFKEAIADCNSYIELAAKEKKLPVENQSFPVRRRSLEELQAYALRIRGFCFTKLGEPVKAIDDLTESIKLSPAPTTYFYRGQAYESVGQMSRAKEDYATADKQGYSTKTRTASSMLREGNSLLAQGNPREALAVLDKAAQTDKEAQLAVISRRVHLFETIGAWKEVLSECDKESQAWQAKNHTAYKNYIATGTAHWKLGELDAALQDFSDYIKIAPWKTSYLTRALLYSQMGNYAKAAEDCTASLTAINRPAFSRLPWNQAAVAAGGQAPGLASAGIDGGGKLAAAAPGGLMSAPVSSASEPGDSPALLSPPSGTTVTQPVAATASDAPPADNPQARKAQALLLRADCFVNMQKYQAAIADCSEIISFDGTIPEAYAIRASAYEKLNQPEKAVDDYTKCLSMTPADEVILKRRGDAYMAVHEYKKAISDYTEALGLFPDNPGKIYLARSKAYSEDHQADLAYQDKAMSQNSSVTEAQALIVPFLFKSENVSSPGPEVENLP